jgi:hypothetical protein
LLFPHPHHRNESEAHAAIAIRQPMVEQEQERELGCLRCSYPLRRRFSFQSYWLFFRPTLYQAFILFYPVALSRKSSHLCQSLLYAKLTDTKGAGMTTGPARPLIHPCEVWVFQWFFDFDSIFPSRSSIFLISF